MYMYFYARTLIHPLANVASYRMCGPSADLFVLSSLVPDTDSLAFDEVANPTVERSAVQSRQSVIHNHHDDKRCIFLILTSKGRAGRPQGERSEDLKSTVTLWLSDPPYGLINANLSCSSRFATNEDRVSD